MMVSKNSSVHLNFPALDMTVTRGRAGYNLLKLLEFYESSQKICSNKFRTLSHFIPCLHTHTYTLTCTQTMICKLSTFCQLGTLLDPPIGDYTVSNCTQAKNRSHAEARHTLHQPVHIRASYISRDHVILKGGSGIQL